MSCKEVCDYFSAYLDGEVSETLKKEIEIHFDRCPHCKAILNKANSIREYMKSLSKIKTSDNFEVKLRERISQENTRKRSFINTWTESINYLPNKPAIVFATLAIFVIVFIVLNVQQSNYEEFQFNNTPLQEEILNQSSAGENIISDEADKQLLNGKVVLSADPSGIDDSTGKYFNLKEAEQPINNKVKYINK